MPLVDYQALRHLSPQAFKLYTCFLPACACPHADRHLAQTHQTKTLTLSLADLGSESGLQSYCQWPALRHGNDGQLRKALSELQNSGLIEKHGRRGRAPNTYHLLNLKDTQTQNQPPQNGVPDATIISPSSAPEVSTHVNPEPPTNTAPSTGNSNCR